MSAIVSLAVEGAVDEAVARRLLEHVGADAGPVFGRGGKQQLLDSLDGYNRAATFSPWLVLIDLDEDAECPAAARATWLPSPSRWMCCRIVVREVESWLLSDRQSIAAFLGISVQLVPGAPEQLPDPKRTLVTLARRSRRRHIREDLVPRPGSGRDVGSGYTSQMTEYVRQVWHPDVAARESDSLQRCLTRLSELVAISQ